jgi:VIT1/CCC1 family predicted Fe2+/Mn2+ transporter
MAPEQARLAAADVMRRPDDALIVHAREELGVDPTGLASPVKTAVLSFLCFAVGALAPVVPWFGSASGTAPTLVSIGIAVIVAGVVGGLIASFAERPMATSIARQILIVLGACAITYGIGQLVGINVS